MTRCDKQLNFIPLAKNVLFRMRQKKLHQTMILKHNFLSYIDVIHTDYEKIIMIYFVQCTKHFKRKEENVGKNCFSTNILISAWHVFYEIPNGAQWSIKPISHYWDPLPRPGLSYYGKWQQGRIEDDAVFLETQVEGKQENQNDPKSDQSSRTKSLFLVFARWSLLSSQIQLFALFNHFWLG